MYYDAAWAFRAAGAEMMRTYIELGGTVSGEHGIGTEKLEAMRWQFSPETLTLLRRVKAALDPEGLANPGKLIPVWSFPVFERGGKARVYIIPIVIGLLVAGTLLMGQLEKFELVTVDLRYPFLAEHIRVPLALVAIDQ